MLRASLQSKCGTHLLQETNHFLTTSQSFLDVLPCSLSTASSLSPYRIKTDEELGEGM